MRPPVSRMGSKSGYADRILTLLGLVPGQGAGHYLWCEPDAGCRLLLEAYRDAGLARAAADIIRGWADEEPRALWERLRAEGPPRDLGGYEVARWAWVQGHGDASKPPRLAAQYLNPEGNADGTWKAPPRDWLARRAGALPELQASIAPDARAVDPREVARVAFVQRLAGRSLPWGSYCDIMGRGGRMGTGQRYAFNLHKNPIRLDSTPTLPATIAPDARAMDPGAVLPAGTVVYVDPPYVGTTGYAADLDRAEVVGLARRWAGAGALVAISEAEPISDLVAEGWHAVEVTDCRRGQARTFSRQQSEWVTLNRVPVETVGPVFDLFG